MNTKSPSHLSLAGILSLPLTLAACTSMPDVKIPYYLPLTEVPVSVTRVVTCSGTAKDQHRMLYDLIAVSDVKPRYVADTSIVLFFNTMNYDHVLSDTELDFQFHDDGRLSGVNGSATGKGPEIIRAVAGTLMAASGTGAAALLSARPNSETPPPNGKDPIMSACTHIDEVSPRGTVDEDKGFRHITLSYQATIRMKRGESPMLLQTLPTVASQCPETLWHSTSWLRPTLSSMVDHCAMRDALGDLHLKFDTIGDPAPWPGEVVEIRTGLALSNGLFVANPAMRTVEILQCPSSSSTSIASAQRGLVNAEEALSKASRDFDSADGQQRDQLQLAIEAAHADDEIAFKKARFKSHCDPIAITLASFNVADSSYANPVVIPLPEPAAFGGQEFSLTLADSGRVTKLRYKKVAMGDAASDAATSLVDLLRSRSDAEEAKLLNDEADKIKAMQRLANCRANAACE
ncbi:MAG: hypothetical protein LCH70_08890 [Proteobacteria bacterium]|nr:hypothetical protein [Pseudomonadota bacterium]